MTTIYAHMLTVKQIDAAKPAEKIISPLLDSGGLFLFVPPSGKRCGECATGSKERKRRWSSVPIRKSPLTEAVAKQSDAKMKPFAGVDPSEQKQAIKKKEKEEVADSFGDIFRSGMLINRRYGRKDMLTK